MALNGIQINVKLFESVINSMADQVTDYLLEDFTEEAWDRAGVDADGLTLRLQADPVFRQIVEAEVLDILQNVLNDLNDDYEISSNIYNDLAENHANHWVAQMLSDLDQAQQELEIEERICSDVEKEQSLVDALRTLEQHGIQVRSQDPALAHAMRIAQQAGYEIVKTEA